MTNGWVECTVHSTERDMARSSSHCPEWRGNLKPRNYLFLELSMYYFQTVVDHEYLKPWEGKLQIQMYVGVFTHIYAYLHAYLCVADIPT